MRPLRRDPLQSSAYDRSMKAPRNRSIPNEFEKETPSGATRLAESSRLGSRERLTSELCQADCGCARRARRSRTGADPLRARHTVGRLQRTPHRVRISIAIGVREGLSFTPRAVAHEPATKPRSAAASREQRRISVTRLRRADVRTAARLGDHHSGRGHSATRMVRGVTHVQAF